MNLKKNEILIQYRYLFSIHLYIYILVLYPFLIMIIVFSFICLTAYISVFLQFRGTRVLLLGVFGPNSNVLCAMG